MGDEPPGEPSHVVWLQARDAFADLRVPLAAGGGFGVDAFAGTTTFEAGALTWHHALDLNGTFAGFDCGAVENTDDHEMIERGVVERDGKRIPYEEVWQRVDEGAVGLVLTAPEAIVVRVGDHALAMRDARRGEDRFDVRYACAEDNRWTDVTVLGRGAELPCTPSEVPADLALDSTFELDAAMWRVVECWT